MERKMKYELQVKLPIGWWTAMQTSDLVKAIDKYARLAKQKHSVRIVKT
jgi:hypothetical protein